MCGRYALYGPVSRLRECFDAEPEGFKFEPRWNAAPMQWLPVVREEPGGKRVIQLMRWGLVPTWATDESIATRLINARSESLAEKPSFRAAFRRRRCIVPANGFYEWKLVGNTKLPFYIHPVEDELFGLGGVWEHWTRPADGVGIDTFTIITTNASTAIRAVHDRMPLILEPATYSAWLDGATPLEQAHDLMQPSPGLTLTLHPVSRAVSNVRNEGATLIQPV